MTCGPETSLFRGDALEPGGSLGWPAIGRRRLDHGYRRAAESTFTQGPAGPSNAPQQIPIPELQEVRGVHGAAAVEIQGGIVGREAEELIAEGEEVANANGNLDGNGDGTGEAERHVRRRIVHDVGLHRHRGAVA